MDWIRGWLYWMERKLTQYVEGYYQRHRLKITGHHNLKEWSTFGICQPVAWGGQWSKVKFNRKWRIIENDSWTYVSIQCKNSGIKKIFYKQWKVNQSLVLTGVSANHLVYLKRFGKSLVGPDDFKNVDHNAYIACKRIRFFFWLAIYFFCKTVLSPWLFNIKKW